LHGIVISMEIIPLQGMLSTDTRQLPNIDGGGYLPAAYRSVDPATRGPIAAAQPHNVFIEVIDTSSDVSFDLQLAGTVPSSGEPRFVRGDANGDASIDISDPVRILFYLFVGGVSAPCQDVLDVNDSGLVDLSDAIFLLNFLFRGGSEIPAPYPAAGLDPTEDTLPPCE
jgi:hypothetical protein